MNQISNLLFVFALGCASKDSGPSSAPGLPSTDDTASSTVMPDDGCIRINGQGGFSTIAAAVDWSKNGDVITLCSGEYAERVIIEKSITLKGPTSGDPAVIRVADETSAISVRADNVNLSWMTINSGGVGIFIQEVDNIALQVLSFGELGDTAIRAEGSTNVLLQASSFEDLPHGVLHVDEAGSARVVNCIFDGIQGYAARARTGASLSLEGNEFYGNVEDVDGKNAAARVTDGASVSSSSNLYSSNSGIAISGADSSILSTSDTFVAGTHAIVMNDGTLSVDQATITDPTVTGIRARTTDGTVSISNSSISADPLTNTLSDAESWDIGKADLGVGAYIAAADSVTVTNTEITNFNHGGISITASGDDLLLLDVSGVTIDGTGWQGLFARDVDATITDVSVSNVRPVGEVESGLCSTVGENSGATFRESEVDWIGGALLDNFGVGLGAISTTTDVSGLTVSGSGCAGIMNFGGTLTVDDSDFSAPSTEQISASVVNYNATSSSVTNSRFIDSGELSAYASAGDESYKIIYYDRLGSDIQAWFGGTHTVDGNTFTNGAQSVYGNASDLTVTNNSWSEYSQYGVLIYEGTASLTNNSFDNSSGHAAACIQGTMSITDLTVDTTVTSTYRSYEIYVDGVLSGSYPESNAFPALYTEGCDMNMADASFTDTVAMAARVYGGAHTISNTSVTRPNTGVFYASGGIEFADTWERDLESFFSPIDLTMTDVYITETGWGGGLSFMAEPSTDGSLASSLTAVNLEITDVGGTALSISNATVDLTALTIDDISGAGISATSSVVNLSASSIQNAGSAGLSAVSSTLDVSGTTIQSTAMDGLTAIGGAVTITDSSIKQNNQDGLDLSGVTATLTGNDITDNLGYGIRCGGSTFSACDNTFAGNALGATDTCDTECGVAPDDGGPDDGGPDDGDDTGIPTDDDAGDSDDTGIPADDDTDVAPPSTGDTGLVDTGSDGSDDSDDSDDSDGSDGSDS